jgi:hypothetical protein
MPPVLRSTLDVTRGPVSSNSVVGTRQLWQQEIGKGAVHAGHTWIYLAPGHRFARPVYRVFMERHLLIMDPVLVDVIIDVFLLPDCGKQGSDGLLWPQVN